MTDPVPTPEAAPHTYYCWIRTLDSRTDTAARQDDPAMVSPFYGGRPPRVKAPLHPAGMPEGTWQAVEPFFGRAGATTAFDYGPVAFVDPADATDWLYKTPAGRQWDREAENRFLMAVQIAAVSGGAQ